MKRQGEGRRLKHTPETPFLGLDTAEAGLVGIGVRIQTAPHFVFSFSYACVEDILGSESDQRIGADTPREVNNKNKN